MQEPELAIVELQVVLSERDDIDELVVVYLLVSILKRASDETTLPSKVSLFKGMFHCMHAYAAEVPSECWKNFCMGRETDGDAMSLLPFSSMCVYCASL